ncbi:transducin beta 3 isoform B [Micractinium conductrix]|uniref:Transducin beta 3 isoform B n=1 Tax=Micractinium conductrix TaxID=554055 RepID=A0A2P6V915_9CHLO|nr:transducin beta 3 isoform B [Micractinium conductrix]|eukprot:PSC70582.1 transducin beta 3 isoform B [Micractinium conductrix]
MVLLENAKFLTELHKLYEGNKTQGSVWVTMKRTNMKPRKGKKDYSEHAYHCLVRATDGTRKLSTVVQARELARFQESYTTIMRGHMDSLKKRDRTRHAPRLELAEAVESPLAVAVGLCFEHLLYFANLWERMAPREQANRYGNRGCAQRGASRFASPSLGTFGRLQAAQQSAWHLRIGRGGKPGPAMAAAKQNYRVRQRLEVFYTGGSVRLSADGRLLACACADEVKVVDAASGTVVQTLPGDSEPVTALGFSPNAHLLFTASRSLQLRCWSLDGGAPAALRSYKGHKAPVADMAVHASGGLLATGSADRTVRVWDVDGGFCTHSFTGHSGVVLRVLFHPKELMVISAGDDAEVRVWDLVTKSCAAVLKGHFSAVTALSLSPDGWTLLCGGRDSVVTVWNLSNHSKLATVPVYEALEGLAYLPPGAPFPGLPASSGGRQGGKAATPVCFATGGERGVVQLWRADTGKCVYEQPAAAAAAASAAGGIVELELLPGGAGLLTATQDCRLLMHAPAGGDLAVTRQLIGNNDEVTDMRFLTLGGGDGGDGGGDGAPTHLAVSTNSDQIRLFDARTLSCTATLAGHTDTVLALDALRLPGGAALLASAGKDASLRLWSLPAARCVGVGAGHVSAVSCVAFARRGGNFVATGGADKLLKVWDTAALAMDAAAPAKLRVTAAVAAHDKDINAVAVAPNDSVICTGSQDRTAKVWQLPDLVLSLTLKGHKRGIWAVAFSPVDKAVATASGDKTVRLWSLADGSCLRTFEGHLSSVLRLDFLSAGTQILSAGADGLLKLWSVRLSECVNTFDAHEDKVWALALDGRNADVLASGGGDGAVAIWEDCTSADADEAAAATAVAVLKEQDLANALQMEDWERAAALAFEMRHPGRLLRVVRQALERGQQEGGRILSRLAGGMSADDLRQCLEYCREWNSNAKNCHAAQAMLQAVLRQRRPQELLSVPGLGGVLEGMLPYTQRHFARADRLLRSTFLCDYIVGAMGSMAPAGDDAGVGGAQLVAGAAPAGTHQLEAQQQAPEPRRRPARALLGAAPLPAPAAAPAAAAAALAVAAAQQPEQQQQQQSEEEREEDVAEPAANGHSQAQPNGTADDASGDSSSDEEDGRGMAAAAAAAAAAAKKRPARVPAAKTPAAKPSSSKAKVPPATAGKAVRQQAAAKKRRLSA